MKRQLGRHAWLKVRAFGRGYSTGLAKLAFVLAALAGICSVYAGSFKAWSLTARHTKDCRAAAFKDDLDCELIPLLCYGGTALFVIGIGGIAYQLVRTPKVKPKKP